MTILADIIKKRKQTIALLSSTIHCTPSTIDFMRIFDRFAFIAELKSRSPSQGSIVSDYDPVAIAKEYANGGASALSILTEPDFFNGAFTHLLEVSGTCSLPILCKDFIVDQKQIHIARACGATACLLIVAALTDAELSSFKTEIERLNMTAVIEVFNAEELQRALQLKPAVIQINHRDLKTFSVDVHSSESLADRIPQPIKVIAASGIAQPEDILQLSSRINGVLVGTALMQSKDRVSFLKTMRALKP